MNNNIRSERVKMHMTQKELAKEIGVATYTIGIWERDIHSCPAHRLASMCELFGVSMDYLTGRTEART